jgi:hypothetical protein
VADGAVYYGDAGGLVWALDAATGDVRWHFRSGPGGFVTSPLVAGRRVLIGSRDGSFYGLDAATGRQGWRFPTGGPIRCTAALAGQRVIFASDDMHAYALDVETGELAWKSDRLYGQSFRDYYPVVISSAGSEQVVLRSVCAEETNQELNGTTQFLQRLAGVPGGWRELDEFFKSDRTRGTPDLIRGEQQAILKLLVDNPYRRTCFVLDVRDGHETARVPLLYSAGNQGCGFPPALDSRGEPLVFYRTVYSNWNRGVKPAVGVGYLDVVSRAIKPLRHANGSAPPWNTFWGTSDESQNFTVGGDVLYICHQGTLCGLDLKTLNLFPIHGNRDTWGGLLTPIWAANEWHGPARGGCAVSDDELFWITGSRVLCLRHGRAPSAERQPSPWRWESTPPRAPGKEIDIESLVAEPEPRRVPTRERGDRLRSALSDEVREFLDGHPWAPLYVQMGIGSRDFFFAHPSFAIEAMAMAHPHLPPELAKRAEKLAAAELPSALRAEPLPLDQGRRRELFAVPPHALTWSYPPRWPPLSHLYSIWLYGHRTGDWSSIQPLWPRIAETWREYQGRPLDIDPRLGGHLWLNRTANGCLAFARLAKRFGAPDESQGAAREFERLLRAVVEYHRAAAARADRVMAQSTSRGDIQGNQGRLLYFPLNNHKLKMALWLDLSPELARGLESAIPAEVVTLSAFTGLLMPAFHLAAEERQVHYGENFIDLPDSMHGLFRAHALLWRSPPAQLEIYTDLPWCRADLFHIEKLAFALDGSP